MGRATRFVLPVCGVVWLISLAVGLAMIIDFDARPGELTETTSQWPDGTKLVLDSRGKTLVMFVHPACPCSLASLNELDRLVRSSLVPSTLYVVFVGPRIEGGPLPRLVARAGEIANATLRFDPTGEEANRFDGRTSGTLFVFSATGELAYCGGVTPGRGHIGPNSAWDAAAAAIAGPASADSMPVFGCPLF